MNWGDIIKYGSIAMLILLIVFLTIPGIYTDFLWFGSLGLSSIFVTILTAKLALGLFSALLFFVILYLNWRIVKRVLESEGKTLQKTLEKIIPWMIGSFALISGIVFSFQWSVVLKFLNATSFGILDPVFGNDISFYVFSLPFYKSIVGFLLGAAILSLLMAFSVYLFYTKPFGGRIRSIRDIKDVMSTHGGVKDKAKIHLSVLAGFFFIFVGLWSWLARYDVLFSKAGAVFGAAYTDIHITLPLLTIVAFVSGILGILFLVEWKIKNLKYPMMGVGFLIAVIIVGSILGVAVQQLQVRPDEYNTEKPYIARNINYTSQAFDLDQIEEISFQPHYNMSYQELNKNNVTLNNIRLWDYRALKDTYSQLQLIRSYYDFNDVDTDRYYVAENETETYYQVMLSPRELNQQDLPEKAKTWVNQHLVYTHGYGVTMSPVNRISQEGFPQLWIKDIPPKAKEGLEINRSEIYYGEQTNEFVVVNTKTEEFDYPQGGENVYTNYNGSGGVELSGISKLAYTMRFGSFQIMLSGSITPDSKIMLHRDIKDRVKELAPFLSYDSDPYMVASEGGLYWIIDAYTTTDSYPYSEQYGLNRTDANYIRNSVKVTVNAYTGEVNFYVIEEEPLIATYRKIFPDLFKNFSEMPTGLKKHIRYPEDLFRIQAQVYSTYHMNNPRVFYNKEDQWRIPNELYSGNKIKMEPYYVLMDLPRTDGQSNFIMMTPFTPEGRYNMIGWMGAKSDPPDYGEKVVYQFSKQELIYGPAQIESRIDQDPEISQRMTLWSQSGSRVIRGNLLVIPVEQSLLYVEPVYLRASGESSIPQLKRVIVAYGDKLAMRESLNTSLQAVFTEEVNKTVPEEPGEQPIEGSLQDLITQAVDKYETAQTLLKEGDFSGYAERIEQLGETLNQINQFQDNQTSS